MVQHLEIPFSCLSTVLPISFSSLEQWPCGENQSPSWLEPGTGLIEVGYRGKKAHIQALICAPKLVYALVCAPKLVCGLVCALVCAPKLVWALLCALVCAPIFYYFFLQQFYRLVG